MSVPQPHTGDEVSGAINVLVAHQEHYWGFCNDAEYEFACASCNANQLRRQLESIAGYLGVDD